MSRKVLIRSLVVGICMSVIFTACAPQPDVTMKVVPEAKKDLPQVNLSLKFVVGDTTMYKVANEDSKDFRFEQPSLGKLREEPKSTTSEIKFLQQIQGVDEKGGAVAMITIKDIKYLATDKDEVKFDFDSERESDKKKPFGKLLGKSYRIRISPQGSVEVLDARNIRSAVTSGQAKRVATSLLSDESIQRRHEIPSLPDTGACVLRQGDTWTIIKAAHQRLMVPKSFKKVYTLSKVEDEDGRRVAFVDMNATESATPDPDAPKTAGGIGLFANLFDTEETYTGNMVLDLDSGKMNRYNEKFVTKYVAAEQSREQKPDKGPDVLTIVLTYTTVTEKVN
jgi:hypothetical protein